MKEKTIPRKFQAILTFAAVLLLAAAYYIAAGCPLLTFHQEFRRAEKINMVGPSQIVDTVTTRYWAIDKLMVGKTEYGFCFFGKIHNDGGDSPNYFSYRAKTDDITVLAAPNGFAHVWADIYDTLPVYIFCDYPEAVRADLELTVTGSDSINSSGEETTTYYSETFKAQAEALEPGVLRCYLESYDLKTGYALNRLSDICSNYDSIFIGIEYIDIPCTVKLYDADDNLIIEKDLLIRTTAAEAQAQREAQAG